MTDDERRERGMKIRREVLGDAHVDRAQANTTPLTKDFQDLITRYAWGEIWARPDSTEDAQLHHGRHDGGLEPAR